MLAKLGFTAWAPNLRGYGNTARPSAVKDYSLRALVEDVAQLIIASGKRVTLIGHDWEDLSHGSLQSLIVFL